MAFDVAAGPAIQVAPSRPAGPRPRRRRIGGRTLCLIAVVVLHAAPLISIGTWGASPPVVPPPETIIAVELVRPQAPMRPSERPPGPLRPQTAEASETRDPSRIEPRLSPLPPPPNIETVVRPPRTPPATASPSRPSPAAEATAPPAPIAPIAGPASAAPQTWQARVLAQLDRHKRYPEMASLRRREGVARVRFAMNRQGRVLRVALERSSGHADLDREALATVRRAQPLPTPPDEVLGDPLELTVPIEFFVSASP